MAVTKVVKEGDGCDQTYRGSASRGLQSPFMPVPLWGAHRFLPIIAQGFNPGWPCAPAASRQRKMIIDQGLRVETLGYDKACKACPAGAHRSAGLKPRWYRPWEAWLKTLIALHRRPIRVFCCIVVYT